jgi:cation:H+ antiporter
MPIAEFIELAIGVVVIYFGAEWLVRSSSSIAHRLNIRPAIAGLTLVAIGTSAPELVVSTLAAMRGSGGMAVGNIIGSNVANIGLVLGIAALVSPVHVERTLIRREVPICLGAAILFYLLSLDGSLNRIDGLILIGSLVAFIAVGTKMAMAERESGNKQVVAGAMWKSGLLALLGIMLLAIGGRLLVGSAIFVAKHYGISEIFVGITMVAIGTSLPELATSVVASVKGENDICVGNVIGSNIYNILLVMGVVAIVQPIPIASSLLRCEFPFMLGATILMLPILRSGFRISRVEGGVLLAGYAAFVYFSYIVR